MRKINEGMISYSCLHLAKREKCLVLINKISKIMDFGKQMVSF